MTGDKPEGAKVGWHLRETRYPITTKWIKVREDTVDVEGHGELNFTYLDLPPAVGIVPVTREGTVVLIRQYRFIVDAWCLEVPAGGSHDAGDESLDDVARHEIREEIGASCDELLHVSHCYLANGAISQLYHVYLALGVTLDNEPAPEPTEHIELHPMPIVEAVDMARNGKIEDGPSALSLLLCEPLLRERGYL
jgi:ADP-ribose pyrophosphatase